LDDFGALFSQLVRAVIQGVHECADAQATFTQQPDGMCTGLTSSAGDQE
jgi:hypothetical protein